MVSAIWWIYYDSFHLLEQRKLTTGHSILYSHFFLFIGLAILASLIRHAILGDLDPGDFRQLAAAGTGAVLPGQAVRLLHGGSRAAALPAVQHRGRVRPDGTGADVAARARGHAGGHHGDDDLLRAAQPALPPPGARRAGADLSRCSRSTRRRAALSQVPEAWREALQQRTGNPVRGPQARDLRPGTAMQFLPLSRKLAASNRSAAVGYKFTRYSHSIIS